MSPEERQLLQGLFDRMRPNASNFRDREAEQLIADSVRQQPYAPYLLAQTVIVQDQALQAANDRLQQLEHHVQELEQRQQPQGGGGFLSSIFGGGSQQPLTPSRAPMWNQGGAAPNYQQQGYAPPPPPQQGGPWGGQPQQGGGGGFLHGALGTAAGVAGGVLAADAIGSLFRSGHAGGGLGIASGVPGFGGGSGNETVVNNYYGDNDPAQANSAANAQQDSSQDMRRLRRRSDLGAGRCPGHERLRLRRQLVRHLAHESLRPPRCRRLVALYGTFRFGGQEQVIWSSRGAQGRSRRHNGMARRVRSPRSRRPSGRRPSAIRA